MVRRLSWLDSVRLIAKLARMERRSAKGRPRLDMLRRGFFSDRAGLYPLDRFDVNLFLTDWEIEARLARINPEQAAAFLNNKLLFHLLLERLAVPVARPSLVGLAIDGAFVGLNATRSWHECFAAGAALIAKPIDGSGGDRVALLDEARKAPKEGTFLLERPIAPHRYARTVFPGALNTIRVVTARDPATREPFVLGAAHRFGTARSAPTDNRKKGGLVSSVDGASGAISAAVGLSGSNERVVHERHPETGARIEGVVVPGWPAIEAAALTLARSVPGLVFVGWDLAVTPDGPVVVEGNAALPNPNLLQMHQPLLGSPRARGFFRDYAIITAARAEAAARGSTDAAVPSIVR